MLDLPPPPPPQTIIDFENEYGFRVCISVISSFNMSVLFNGFYRTILIYIPFVNLKQIVRCSYYIRYINEIL